VRQIDPDTRKPATRISGGADYGFSACTETPSNRSKEPIMNRKKRIRRLVAALAACGAALLVSSASAHGTAATLTIRHQMRGCHTWSFDGGAFKATQSIRLSRGATLAVKNNDVMPHKLVRTSGPAVQVRTASMSRMGAVARVRFTKAGVYHFKTKPGEDYSWASNMETKGEDNVLRLTVTVH
jgi:plastocyanin